MFEERDTKALKQGEFWVVRDHLPAAAAGTFYRKLDETLHAINFAAQVREICRPAYQDTSAGGRPGIDPVVYFKMLMIGFFENLPSERSIASRCEDSLSLRAFLGYDLTEDRIHERESGQGNFVSITYTIVARSREQVIALVEELAATEGVVMVI